MTEQRADYDNPWKEAMSLYFQPFMAFFFPHIHDNINWRRGYEFLDKELQQIVRDAEIGRREADKLVKVWQNSGKETWLLLHIEIQSQAQSVFAERMYVYNNRIFDRYRQKVVSLAILADDEPSWRPTKYSYEIWGCEVLLKFPMVKLLDYQQDTLKQSTNPMAVIVEAHLGTQQTTADPTQRYQAKLRIAKSLYQRGYSRQDILELLRLVEWMMTLPDFLELDFQQEIIRFEEETKMPYILSFERKAIQAEQAAQQAQQAAQQAAIQARQEAAIQARQEAILEALRIRFENVPSSLESVINQIEDDSVLKTLHRQAITIGSLEEFQQQVSQLTLVEKKDDIG
ncbi:MAG: transposase [Stigonema ocellatum SAG 48.90 = DSM 106950]|nr:transposase [Stigonema ocellatum SAG 48.90 = DSM 106950]